MTFKKLNNFSIVATFFALWLAVFFEDQVEDALACVLIFTFGILHGANDLKLISFLEKSSRSARQILVVFLYYVFFVLVSAVVFFFLPPIALFLFIFFSAYHFGEQHWASKLNVIKWPKGIFYTSYGFLLFFLLFSAHSQTVSDVIMEITGFFANIEYYNTLLWFSAISTVSIYAVIQKGKVFTGTALKELFYIFLFFVVFNTASLLWSFAIYFILWHSLPSLLDQIKYLYGGYSRKNVCRYLQSSSIYWIISVVALTFLLLFSRNTDQTFLALFFSFIAAVTFPHVLVISKLYQN